jgi:hypothetical protein
LEVEINPLIDLPIKKEQAIKTELRIDRNAIIKAMKLTKQELIILLQSL